MQHPFFVGLALVLCLVQGRSQTMWTDHTAERFVDSLMQIMTLEEKIGQMTLFTSDWDVTGPTLRAGYRDDVRAGRVGAIFNAHTSAYNHALQRVAVEETRLGIPLLFGYDVIHGYRTIFPMPLAETASWEPALAEQSSRIAAIESTAAGLHWTFAPMVDIARDPRWGRIMEGSGEDPYLGSQFAAARVRGFQGSDLASEETLLACAKHFAGYGYAQAGRDYHTVDLSERTLRDVILPPFIAAAKAGAATFMTSFNEWDGIPASGSRFLLTEVLRDEWRFDGFVVTDYTSINEMVKHGVAADMAAAGKLAVQAGVDMDMQGAVFHQHLAQQVANGEVSITLVNDAVRRILRLKYALGLFADPYRYGSAEREQTQIRSAGHRAAARDIARRSMVLLKNEGNILPLSNNLRRVAVIGPLADSKADMLGAWHADGRAEDCVTLLEGIRARLGNNATVTYAKGCDVLGSDRTGFAEALNIARRAEVIVVGVGEHDWMSGEAASKTDITLPGQQLELVRQLLTLGKPLVVVLMNGRPLAIPELTAEAPAILEAWFGGNEAGHAMADVLFGDYNPAGKLPATFPRHVGQVPLFYAAKNTGRPINVDDKYTSKYLDQPNTPLFPFGYGLSYTTFAYKNLEVNQPTFRLNDTVRVTVTLTNTGSRAGEEVAQLYVRDRVGSVTRPVRELKGFQKVMLQPGESKQLEFLLTSNDLAFYRADNTTGTEPGFFDLFVGSNSDADLSATVQLLE